jgi:hypothetical protein
MSQSIEENVDVIRRGFESINRVGPDGAREFMDADIVLEMPEGLIDAGSYHGREALMRGLARLLRRVRGLSLGGGAAPSHPRAPVHRRGPSKTQFRTGRCGYLPIASPDSSAG